MRWICVRQLKNLRRFPVPPEILAAGRVRLVAVIEAAPMIHRKSAWFASAAWRPVMAAMIVIVTVTGGGTFVAAHDALPGERLYVVKLAGEEFRERMTLTSEQRFVVQAAHASRRLEETEQLLTMQGLGDDVRAARVRKAMNRYEGHLFVMNEIAVRLETDPQKPQRGKKALKAAEGMLDRHVQLMESATRAEPVVASLVLEPTDAAFSLEADMFSAIPADDGGTDGDAERHRRERAEKFSDSLARMRADLEDRARGADDPEDREDLKEEDPRGRSGGDDEERGGDQWVDTGSPRKAS
jgi:hypothetical protein